MRMKVNRALLIASIEEAMAREQKELAEKKAAFPKLEKAARLLYIENLKKYIEQVKSGGEIYDSYRLDNKMKVDVEFPKEVVEGKFNRHADALKRLRMVTTTEIELTDKDDYFQYI